MKKITGLVFALSLILGGFNIAKADYHWTNVSSGLEGGQIYSLLQDSDGSFYAGGESCVGTDCTAKIWVLRTGSSQWKDLTKNLSGSHIYSLIEGSDGAIYAGGRGFINSTTAVAKVWKYKNTSWTNTWTEVGSPSENQSGLVFSLLQAANGTLYAGGYNCDNDICYAKVWEYSSGAWTDTMGNSSSGYVSSLFQTFDHTIYAGGWNNVNAKAWRYDSNSWTEITSNLSDDAPGPIISLIQARDGSIYAGGSVMDLSGSSDHANTLVSAGYLAKVWQYSPFTGLWTEVSNGLAGTSVNTLLLVGGKIYAGGYDSQFGAKIWKLDSGSWTDAGGDLSGTNVRSIIQGSDGSLYAGGYYGSYAQVWKYASSEIIKQQQNLVKAKKVTLSRGLKGYGISGQGLIFLFNKIPSGKKWMQWIKYTGYPYNWASANKQALKTWWKMTNNFGDKSFSIQTKFVYTDKELGNLNEQNLKLKYFDAKSKTWKLITQNSAWKKYKVKHSLKNNTFTVTFKKFPEKEMRFAIGL